MNIRVNIERIVLDGIDVPRSQRPLLRATVGAELSRLLASTGLASVLMTKEAIPQVPTGTIQLTGNSDPSRLGKQIAQAVYGGIGK